MSIINDALKKTQSAREKKLSTPSPTPSTIPSPTPQLDPTTVKTIATQKDIDQVSTAKKNPNSHRIVILSIGLVLIIFGLLFNTIMKPIFLPEENIILNTEQTTLPPIPGVIEYKTPFIQVKKTAAPKIKMELLPFKNTQSKEELTLNGIVYGDNGKKSFVLINNEIYEVGDSVDGKKVMEITRKEVTLDNDGQPLILKLRNYSKNGQ